MSTTDTRAAFEAWARSKERLFDFDGTKPNSAPWYYFDDEVQDAWETWQAATEAAKATGTAQTKQSFENIEELPPLPEQLGRIYPADCYTADQMRAYGQQCAEAARQPAPALPVKPWETRMQEYFAQGSVKMRTPASFMADEIIDSRAALAATAAPVLSGKPKEGEKGWRPACCDGGGEGSPCCDFGGCAANNELAEMREEANRSQP